MTHESKTYEPEALNQCVPGILAELEQLRDSAKRARQKRRSAPALRRPVDRDPMNRKVLEPQKSGIRGARRTRSFTVNDRAVSAAHSLRKEPDMLETYLVDGDKGSVGRSNNVSRNAHIPYAILRFPDVKSLTGYSRSTIYRCIAQGLFTKPVRLSERAVGWPSGEIAALNVAHIAGKSNDEIRALVEQLHAVRTFSVRRQQAHTGCRHWPGDELLIQENPRLCRGGS